MQTTNSLSLSLLLLSGYGFVDFESPTDAMRAVQCLQTAGVMAQFAKVANPTTARRVLPVLSSPCRLVVSFSILSLAHNRKRLSISL